MYKNLKTPAVECLENGTTVPETFSCKTIFFKIDQLIADSPKSSKHIFYLSQYSDPLGQVANKSFQVKSAHREVGPTNSAREKI